MVVAPATLAARTREVALAVVGGGGAGGGVVDVVVVVEGAVAASAAIGLPEPQPANNVRLTSIIAPTARRR
jgi:hypothetical protein